MFQLCDVCGFTVCAFIYIQLLLVVLLLLLLFYIYTVYCNIYFALVLNTNEQIHTHT